MPQWYSFNLYAVHCLYLVAVRLLFSATNTIQVARCIVSVRNIPVSYLSIDCIWESLYSRFIYRTSSSIMSRKDLWSRYYKQD